MAFGASRARPPASAWCMRPGSIQYIAGRHKRICTTILEASGGRLFPKLGAEAVYAVGTAAARSVCREDGRHGGLRGLHAVVVELLRRFDWLGARVCVLRRVSRGDRKNAAGLEVGFLEVERRAKWIRDWQAYEAVPAMPALPRTAHSALAGRVQCICGSPEMPGAAQLVVRRRRARGAGP
ncbi:MAG: asparaginase [Planctomycetota bacterium]